MRVAIDSGGTFTDCVYVKDGRVEVLKVFSTPADPGSAVLAAVRQVSGGDADVDLRHGAVDLRHGTTVGTNAMLERKGARVACVTTAGFEDVIAVGRQTRASLYDWFDTPLPCVVPPELRFGVDERVTAEGVVLRTPSEEHLAELREKIAASRAESIALSLLFSFANPVNEKLVVEALEGLGLPISVSHRILPEFREYERTATVVVNAYLAPKVGGYLRALEAKLPAGAVQVMQSSGGIVSAGLAGREPVRTVLSGPAGGVIGAWHVARQAGIERIIGFDMGGTSTDVALIDGAEGGPKTTSESVVSGLPVAVPMLNIHTVGAGGGSLARFDAGGVLRVGPESAGSVPGPICYGRGTGPTVTDANLVLGRLDPERFLGGAVTLEEARTREWMEAARGGLASVEEFAAGVLTLSETAMEKAIRVISIERGYDPREFTLVCFGGAGPLHACALARALRIPQVMVPCMPGALSALGILMADVVRDYSRTVMVAPDVEALEKQYAELEALGTEELLAEGLSGAAVRSADLRYVGQGFELNVAAGVGMLEKFHHAHEKRYGYANRELAVEVVNVRVRLTAVSEAIELPRQAKREGDGSRARVKMRAMWFEGEWRDCWVYDRELLVAGDVFEGPAMVTEYSSTTVLPPRCMASVDEFGNLLIAVGA